MSDDPAGSADTAVDAATKDRLAEAFIRGFQAGAERPEDAGDGDAMYQAFRDWWYSHNDCDHLVLLVRKHRSVECASCGQPRLQVTEQNDGEIPGREGQQ